MGNATGNAKNRNAKSRNLFQQGREKAESLKTGTGKAGIFKNRNGKSWNL
jgi:hypothetical protein